MIIRSIVAATLLTLVASIPVPNPYAFPQAQDCCMPSPTCYNPCPPPPQMDQPCCVTPTCSNPCQNYGYQPQPFQKSRRKPVVYAPLPGEIVFKLIQNWDSNLLDASSSTFQILEGNIRSAVQAVLGPMTQVTNVYFREGYVPGNPPSRPKTVAHMMVNGGSDSASILEKSVTPDGSLGDGLKVYKDSFNAY